MYTSAQAVNLNIDVYGKSTDLWVDFGMHQKYLETFSIYVLWAPQLETLIWY